MKRPSRTRHDKSRVRFFAKPLAGGSAKMAVAQSKRPLKNFSSAAFAPLPCAGFAMNRTKLLA
ncbi:MAG: hypothetical protein ACK52I_19390 [Pseudomonadota bacterium]